MASTRGCQTGGETADVWLSHPPMANKKIYQQAVERNYRLLGIGNVQEQIWEKNTQ